MRVMTDHVHRILARLEPDEALELNVALEKYRQAGRIAAEIVAHGRTPEAEKRQKKLLVDANWILIEIGRQHGVGFRDDAHKALDEEMTKAFLKNVRGRQWKKYENPIQNLGSLMTEVRNAAKKVGAASGKAKWKEHSAAMKEMNAALKKIQTHYPQSYAKASEMAHNLARRSIGKNPKKPTEFRFQNKTYTVESQGGVDDYGPYNKITIRDHNGRVVTSSRENMTEEKFVNHWIQSHYEENPPREWKTKPPAGAPITYRLKRDRDWQEWQVVAMIGKKRWEPYTYYAGDDKEDAERTMDRLRKDYPVVKNPYMGFKKLTAKLKRRGAKRPRALAAWIGRKKYGKRKFQEMAAAGRRKKSRGIKVLRFPYRASRKAVAANATRKKKWSLALIALYGIGAYFIYDKIKKS